MSESQVATALQTVKALSKKFGLTVGNIYSLIKTEPSFPYTIIGKKKYMIHVAKFTEWLEKRSSHQKSERFSISSADQLIARFKK